MLTNNPQMSLKNEHKKKRRAYLGMILSNKIDRNSVNHPLLLSCLALHLTLSITASTRGNSPPVVKHHLPPLACCSSLPPNAALYP